MKLEGMKQLPNVLVRSSRKNAPLILSVLSVAGLATTMVMVYKATPEILDILYETRNEPKKEQVKELLPVVAPPVIMAGITVSCIIFANKIHLRRSAAIAASYTLAETALEEYQNKVIEVIGEKKHRQIKDSIAGDKLLANPVESNTVIFTDRGDTLMYDSLSGRYFKGDIEKIRRAQNDFNENMFNRGTYSSLNDLYYNMGLEPIGIGEDLGWNVTRTVEFSFSSMLATNNEPCLVIDHLTPPEHDYYDW